jgi:hypothetical protein
MKPLKIKNGELVFPLTDRIRYFFQRLYRKMIIWSLWPYYEYLEDPSQGDD